jgi:hypothetical protein
MNFLLRFIQHKGNSDRRKQYRTERLAKPCRRVQARGGVVAAGNTSWRITVLPGDGIGPEVVGATLAETKKEAVPAAPVRPRKKFETLYFLIMYSAAASTRRFFWRPSFVALDAMGLVRP